jgi:hypothetical protein
MLIPPVPMVVPPDPDVLPSLSRSPTDTGPPPQEMVAPKKQIPKSAVFLRCIELAPCRSFLIRVGHPAIRHDG